jgi:hypothetical protein
MKPFWLVGKERKLWDILTADERKKMWGGMIAGIIAIPLVAIGVFGNSMPAMCGGMLFFLCAAWISNDVLVDKLIK